MSTPTRPDRRRCARGAATAEYCVGTAAAACVGLLLLALSTDGFLHDLFMTILDKAFVLPVPRLLVP